MIIYEKLVTIFVAGVTKTLHRLVCEERPPIPKTAVLELVRPGVFGEITGGDAGRPSLEHQHLHSLLGQLLRHPTSTRSGAYHQRVIDFRPSDWSHCFTARVPPAPDPASRSPAPARFRSATG